MEKISRLRAGQYARIFLFISCMLVLAGCNDHKSARASKPSFKGVELYSWEPVSGKWNFSLYLGPTVEKPYLRS
jgi:hypothetical protein